VCLQLSLFREDRGDTIRLAKKIVYERKKATSENVANIREWSADLRPNVEGITKARCFKLYKKSDGETQGFANVPETKTATKKKKGKKGTTNDPYPTATPKEGRSSIGPSHQ
jgi:hypothetical protein